MSKKKKREIKVDTSHLRTEEEKLVEDTTRVEKLDVFEVSGRVGKYLSVLMIAVGAFLSFFSLHVLGSPEQPPLLTSNLVIALIGFLGVINTLCGLILLAKE